VLRWLTGHIGVHHVHHLASRVPFYRLPAVLRDHPELREVGRLTLGESLRCVRLVLWDEERKELLSFRQLRRRFPQEAPEQGFIATVARQGTALALTVCAFPMWLYLSLSPARSRR
jgi:fatty acid desaturase